jgi:hypothetical protein
MSESIPGSAATVAGSLNAMFDFDVRGHVQALGARRGHARHAGRLFLNPRTGAVVRR